MRILVANDDGVRAPGLAALARALTALGEVTVCAPAVEQSAVGRAITMSRPLRLDKVTLPGLDLPTYAVEGTPTDTVKLALYRLFDGKPDLVVSGINAGGNLGTDIHFSGTVSAAMEAALQGIPSVAVSLEDRTGVWAWDHAAAYALQAIRMAQGCRFPFGTLMNINLPAGTPKGIKLAAMAVLDYGESYEERTDPRNRPYYWLRGTRKPAGDSDVSDAAWLERGYVTVTPIRFDMTDYDTLSQWRERVDAMEFDPEPVTKPTAER